MLAEKETYLKEVLDKLMARQMLSFAASFEMGGGRKSFIIWLSFIINSFIYFS